MKRLTVKPSEAGLRLDRLLAERLSITRALAQRLAKEPDTTINDKPAKPHTALKAGDVIVYNGIPKPVTQPPAPTAPPLRVLFENDDLLMIEKPAGLLVHPANTRQQEATLVDAVRAHFPAIDRVGDDPTRPGIVHRLDRDVSGVMVVAKTQAMFETLKKQFASRETEKEYLALVYGRLSKTHDTIALKIGRSKSRGRMVARPEAQEGKDAVTLYDVIETYKTATYVRVQILTGRTHQIRAHFKGIGHPVVGDTVYKRSYMKNIRPIPMDRLFLHAHKLTVTLADGSRKTATSPLPTELTEVLNALPKTNENAKVDSRKPGEAGSGSAG